MDRLDAMVVLLAVVETGSLSAASRRLGAPLATISRKVSELERHLKAQLVVRTNRKIALTDAGRSYVDAAREILGRVEEAERAAVGEYIAPKGDLVVTAPVVFGRLHVLPIVTAFLKIYPDINLRFLLGDRLLNLAEDHVDAAIRIGDLTDGSLVASRLGTTRRSTYAGRDYLARRGRPGRPEDLAGHDCITFEGVVSQKSWTFVDGKQDLVVPIRARLSVTTAEAAVDAAVAGLGVTRVLSYQAANALREGTLQPVLEAFEPPPWPVHLVHASQGMMALKLRAFLDFATPRLRADLKECGPIRG